ncbi:MAG: zeta toxin family protein [Patescibacteria group bacterium]
MNLLRRIFDFLMKGRNERVSDSARQYVVEHKKEIIEKFAGKIQPVSKEETPLAIFMAGSPGAGKTEFSKSFIKGLPKLSGKILRIDADEVREMLPRNLYNGKNSHLVQGAASKGVDKLVDHAIGNNKNFILDGTFTSHKKRLACGNLVHLPRSKNCLGLHKEARSPRRQAHFDV